MPFARAAVGLRPRGRWGCFLRVCSVFVLFLYHFAFSVCLNLPFRLIFRNFAEANGIALKKRVTMKTLIYRYAAFLLVMLSASLAFAQPDFVPDIMKMRVGEILFQRPKTITFAFRNKGNQALVVENVVPSCGCTTVEWTKDSIAPKQAGLITAVYDAKMLGTFYKELAVYTNASTEPVYLSMEGRVVTSMLDYTGDFPIDLGSLRINTNYVEFDNVNRGDHPVAEFQVVNLERTPYRPELMHLPNYLTVQSFPEVIAGGGVGRIRLTLDSEKLGILGLNQTRIFLSRYLGDKVSDTNEILVSAVLLPDFSNLSQEQLARAPKIKLSADELDFGDLDGKGKMTQTLTISNDGQEPLDIRTVQVFNQALSVSLDKRRVEPGKMATMKVTVNDKYLVNAKNRPRVLLITNDPKQAKTIINVSVKQ